MRVANKIDLLGDDELAKRQSTGGTDRLWISARTGAGLEQLTQRIREIAGGAESAGRGAGGGTFSARQRHVEALRSAEGHLSAGRATLLESQAGELLAEELRLAQQALGEITGEMLPDDLLGQIFSTFCIGK